MTEAEINAKILELYPVGKNWFDDFQVANNSIVYGNTMQWRVKTNTGVFKSLCKDKDVGVLFANTGVWALLLKECGAKTVTASTENPEAVKLATALSSYVSKPITVTDNAVIMFKGDDVFVDPQYEQAFDILYVQAQFGWNFWKITHNLDTIFEGLKYYVREGILFDFSTAVDLGEDYNIDSVITSASKFFNQTIIIDGAISMVLGKK